MLLHAHGVFSSGWSAVESLQRTAARNGIDAVVLTEHLIADWYWAPPLLRGFLGYRVRQPSIYRYGIEKYFSAAAEVDGKVPEVTLITGAEVAPYYYWTGSPFRRDLTMWDWQRNLLILGLPAPSSYRHLPVVGLRESPVESTGDALWLLLMVAAGTGFLLTLNRLKFVTASFLLAVGAGLLILGPPPAGPFSPYSGNEGIAPYQALIDSVNGLGGIALWTQVESKDDKQYSWGRVHTEPHVEVLLQTRDYEGFGAVYPDRLRAYRPGRAWDAALQSYLHGARRNPPFGWGELALHYPGQLDVKSMDQILTVLRAPDRTPQALLEALRNGRGYGVLAAHSDGRLRLDRWEADSGGARALSGEWLVPGRTVTIRAEWSYTGSDSPDISARLIRNGEVVSEQKGVPPAVLVFESEVSGLSPSAYYRLELSGRNKLLLSNPIFIGQEAGQVLNR